MYYGRCDSGSYLQIFIHGESGDTYIMDVCVCIMAAVTVAHTCRSSFTVRVVTRILWTFVYVLWQV